MAKYYAVKLKTWGKSSYAKATQSIEEGETSHHVMKFADGSSLETDIVLFSAGIRPRDELAKASGLAIGERGGIKINQYCQTSDQIFMPLVNVHFGTTKFMVLLRLGMIWRV